MRPFIERRRYREPLSRRLAIVLALVCVGYMTFVWSQAQKAVERVADEAKNRAAAIQRETASRVDQSCRIVERRYQSEVRELGATYDFLRDHPDSELAEPILKELPQTEREVRLAHPPKYCAAKGVGVPHRKIPDVPVRPAFLR